MQSSALGAEFAHPFPGNALAKGRRSAAPLDSRPEAPRRPGLNRRSLPNRWEAECFSLSELKRGARWALAPDAARARDDDGNRVLFVSNG